MIVIAFFLLLAVSQTRTRDVDYCFAEDDEPYLNMGTKTAYDFVHSGRAGFQTVPNCQPLQVWMTAVHGTSYPSLQELDKMRTLLEVRDQIINNHESRGNGRLCNKDLENLKRWSLNPYAAPETLAPQGMEDMKLLARRLQFNFPDLLQSPSSDISSSNYKFKAIQSERSRKSMDSFIGGMFGYRPSISPEPSLVNDTMLMPYKICAAWNETGNNNTFSYEQRTKFDKEPEFRKLLRDISSRLGYLYNISSDTILTMYNMCRYEKAWTITNLSPWCAIFNKQELRVLEYREDLNYYYLAGYGRDINARLGCPLVKNMISYFRKLERGLVIGEPRGIFYFTDVVSFQNLLTALDVKRDLLPLMGSNFNEMAKRQWRTSLISSFAANLVAVFYKCSGSQPSNKVMFYLAEKPVMFDGCEVGLCDWEYVKSRFGSAECKMDECFGGSGNSYHRIPSLLLALALMLMLIN